MIKACFLLLVLITTSINTSRIFAQGVPAYNHYGASGYFSALLELPGGDIFLTKTNGAFTKTDQNGIEIWSKEIDPYFGVARRMVLMNNGTICMAGVRSDGMMVARVDTSGNILWGKRLFMGENTHFHSIIKTWDEHLLVLGSDSMKEILVKMDGLGNVLWSKHYYNGTGNNSYPWSGGDLLELPDHSLMLFSNVQTMIATNMGSILCNTAATIKLDEDGDVSWAKAYAPDNMNYFPMPFPFNGIYSGGIAAWDIFHASDNSIILTSFWGRTLKVDLQGEIISTQFLSAPHMLTLVSEYPAGTLNFSNSGNWPSDVMIVYNYPHIIRTDVNFSSATAIKHKSPLETTYSPQPTIAYYAAQQLNDKRIALAGESTAGVVVVLADSAGYQECTSTPVPWSVGSDTIMHSHTITVITDTGINEAAITTATMPFVMPHCNCDSMPDASFTYVVSGLTVTFTNTSQNATTYSWSFGDGTYSSDPNPVHTYTTTLPNYGVYLTAGNNCGSKVFHSYLGPNVYVSNSTPVCNGLCQGVATAHVLNGVPPYTYSWNTTPVQTDSTATGLCAGIYEVTVTDGNGLSTIQQVEVQESDFSVDISVQQSVICHGDSTGKLLAYTSTSWGSGSMSFIWNSDPQQNTDSLVHLPGGTYVVMATDNIGCHAYDTVTLSAYDTLTIATTSTTDLNSACIATAEVTVLTGTQPYIYLWSNSETTATASNLCGGQSYVITVTDLYNCVATDTVFITDSITTTGLDNIGISGLTIMPNPVKDVLTIKWDELISRPHFIRITSITGALVQEIAIKGANREAEVNSTDWAQGTYLVSVYDNSRQLIRQVKVIKQ